MLHDKEILVKLLSHFGSLQPLKASHMRIVFKKKKKNRERKVRAVEIDSLLPRFLNLFYFKLRLLTTNMFPNCLRKSVSYYTLSSISLSYLNEEFIWTITEPS